MFGDFRSLWEAHPRPRAVQVFLVLTEQKATASRVKTKTKLFSPVSFAIVVVVVRPKPVKVVSLVEFRRNRPATEIIKTNKFGKSTTPAIVRAPKVLSFSAQQKVARKYIKVKEVLGKVFGTKTTKVKPSKAKQVTLISRLRALKRYIQGDVQLKKVSGKPTTPSVPTKARFLGQSINRQEIAKRVQTKSRLNHPTAFSSPVVIVVRPQKLKVLLQALARAGITKRIVSKSKLSKKAGKPTTKTKVVAPHVLDFAAQQTIKKLKFVLGQVVLGKTPLTFGTSPTGSVVVVYDGLSMADGLTTHKGISRPHIILIPAGGGFFTVSKDSTETDMRSDVIHKETYIIDGELP